MTNNERYGRTRDMAIFATLYVVTVVLTAWLSYEAGQARTFALAGELCDAVRAERLEKHLKVIQQGGVLKPDAQKGQLQAWGL